MAFWERNYITSLSRNEFEKVELDPGIDLGYKDEVFISRMGAVTDVWK